MFDWLQFVQLRGIWIIFSEWRKYLEIDVLLVHRSPVEVRVQLLHLDKVEGILVNLELLVDVVVLVIGLAGDLDIAFPGQKVGFQGLV